MRTSMARGMRNSSIGMEKATPYSVGYQNEPQASTYNFTGPTGGTNGVASTNFTVSIPFGQVARDFVVTPADAGTGNAGVFTPTSVILTVEEPSKTFTYTPGSTGAKTISVTSAYTATSDVPSNSFTNPANITYTSA